MGKFKGDEKNLFEEDLNYIKKKTKLDDSRIKEKYILVMKRNENFLKWGGDFLYLLEKRGLIDIKSHTVDNKPHTGGFHYNLSEKGHKFWYYISSLH